MEKAIDSEAGIAAEADAEEALRQATKQRAEDLLALQRSSSLASRLDLQSARELRDALTSDVYSRSSFSASLNGRGLALEAPLPETSTTLFGTSA